MLDAIRGIQRGLDEMKAGTGKPFREALDEIRAKHKIPRRKNEAVERHRRASCPARYCRSLFVAYRASSNIFVTIAWYSHLK